MEGAEYRVRSFALMQRLAYHGFSLFRDPRCFLYCPACSTPNPQFNRKCSNCRSPLPRLRRKPEKAIDECPWCKCPKGRGFFRLKGSKIKYFEPEKNILYRMMPFTGKRVEIEERIAKCHECSRIFADPIGEICPCCEQPLEMGCLATGTDILFYHRVEPSGAEGMFSQSGEPLGAEFKGFHCELCWKWFFNAPFEFLLYDDGRLFEGHT